MTDPFDRAFAVARVEAFVAEYWRAAEFDANTLFAVSAEGVPPSRDVLTSAICEALAVPDHPFNRACAWAYLARELTLAELRDLVNDELAILEAVDEGLALIPAEDFDKPLIYPIFGETLPGGGAIVARRALLTLDRRGPTAAFEELRRALPATDDWYVLEHALRRIIRAGHWEWTDIAEALCDAGQPVPGLHLSWVASLIGEETPEEVAVALLGGARHLTVAAMDEAGADAESSEMASYVDVIEQLLERLWPRVDEAPSLILPLNGALRLLREALDTPDYLGDAELALELLASHGDPEVAEAVRAWHEDYAQAIAVDMGRQALPQEAYLLGVDACYALVELHTVDLLALLAVVVHRGMLSGKTGAWLTRLLHAHGYGAEEGLVYEIELYLDRGRHVSLAIDDLGDLDLDGLHEARPFFAMSVVLRAGDAIMTREAAERIRRWVAHHGFVITDEDLTSAQLHVVVERDDDEPDDDDLREVGITDLEIVRLGDDEDDPGLQIELLGDDDDDDQG